MLIYSIIASTLFIIIGCWVLITKNGNEIETIFTMWLIIWLILLGGFGIGSQISTIILTNNVKNIMLENSDIEYNKKGDLILTDINDKTKKELIVYFDLFELEIK